MTTLKQHSIEPEQDARILVVEDTPSISEHLCDYLQAFGYQVELAEDGETALDQVQQNRPDLIILDVMLPGIDGFEVCTRLKANKDTRDIPVIFSTGLDDTQSVVKGFEVGGVDYVTKPLRLKEVLVRINTHLTVCKLRKELLIQNERLQEKNIRQKQAQEALEESRERYRMLAEHATDIISRLTAEGIFLYVSPACKTMLGYEIEEMVGRSIYEFVHPEDVAEVKKVGISGLECPDMMVQIARTRCKDDSYIWVETTIKLIRHPKTGNILEVVGVTRNISERKKVLEKLEVANTALEASNRDLETFAQTVAHDLKNPASVVMGYCELWEYKGVFPEEMRGELASLRGVASKMMDIIEALLLLARVRKNTEIFLEPLDMADIVTSAQDRLGRMAAEYGANIQLPNEWPVAQGYAPWIEEVWANYLSNAIKYGGQPPSIRLGATIQSDNMIQCWIQDNGPGLTAEQQARLFAPFARVTQRHVEGYGLGLSIVQNIVEKLGGWAGVESEAEAGCKFYFVLPAGGAQIGNDTVGEGSTF